MEILAATVLAFVGFQAPPSYRDPLLARMVGRWIGQGEKLTVQTGSITPLEARVESVFDDQRLVSTTQFHEESNPPQDSTSTYWIMAGDQAGVYELGEGNGPTTSPTSQGNYVDQTFQVTESLGSAALQSVTHFTGTESQGQSEYVGTFSIGGVTQSVTRIRYNRAY